MKKIISFIITIIFICILGYTIFFGFSKNFEYSKELEDKYDDTVLTEKIFFNNETSFDYISRLFILNKNYKSIINKDKNELCNRKETEIELNEQYSMCIEDELKEELNKELLLQNINSLTDIVKIEKTFSRTTSNTYVQNEMRFYLLKSNNVNIYYSYCLNDVDCKSTTEYYKESTNPKRINLKKDWCITYDK